MLGVQETVLGNTHKVQSIAMLLNKDALLTATTGPAKPCLLISFLQFIVSISSLVEMQLQSQANDSQNSSYVG